jgi:hypothetical protein
MLRQASINLAALNKSKPKRYLADPLEYFSARILIVNPIPISDSLSLMVPKIQRFLEDEDLPEAYKQRFLASLRQYCVDEIVPGAVNAYWLMRLIEPQSPLMQSTIRAWRVIRNSPVKSFD